MSNKNKKTEPKLPGGFRDYGPEESIVREKMIEIISKKFENFGFVPIKTSFVEGYDVLTGGEKNINKQIFRIFRNDKSEEGNMALRFDLTIPLSRFIAGNMSDIKMPFKRYEIGTVWRGERQQAGRFKEFLQCDVDIVGSKKEESDAEIIAVIWSILKTLNVGKFKFKINSREILNILPKYAEFKPSKIENIIRVLDKLDKIGWIGVEKELSKNPINFNASKIDLIKDFVETKGKNSLESIELIKSKVKKAGFTINGAENLFKIIKLVKGFGVPEDIIDIDFSLARGLSYYTGMVLETFLDGKESFGSVASGGRYDGLIERFVSTKIPSVGVSIGFDRLFEAIKDNLFCVDNKGKKIMFLNFDDSVLYDLIEIVADCRNSNIPVEMYVGNDSSIKGQMAYALNAETNLVCIFGSREKNNGIVDVKDLRTKTQKSIKIGNLIEYLKGKINKDEK